MVILPAAALGCGGLQDFSRSLMLSRLQVTVRLSKLSPVNLLLGLGTLLSSIVGL
jgi:hypothetical protein